MNSATYYLIETESVRPDDLRSGIETRCITIQDHPGRTNMSNAELIDGWLGCTNDRNAHAVYHGSWDACQTWLSANGWIPVTEAQPECSVDPTDEDGDCRVYVPEHCRLIEIANVFGNDALDSWLYECRGDVLRRLQDGEDREDIEAELCAEAEQEGYRLVRVDRWIEALAEAVEAE